MYDKASKTWDLRATDQWLVDLIVRRAKEKARVRDKDESKAPLYYSELKALTEFEEDEQRMVRDVSLESIQWNCSPCVDILLQIQTLAPIMAQLAWTVELPATSNTEAWFGAGRTAGSVAGDCHTNAEEEDFDRSLDASAEYPEKEHYLCFYATATIAACGLTQYVETNQDTSTSPSEDSVPEDESNERVPSSTCDLERRSLKYSNNFLIEC